MPAPRLGRVGSLVLRRSLRLRREGGRRTVGREGLIHPNKVVCSNVAVDLNTGIEELPASPSASFLAH